MQRDADDEYELAAYADGVLGSYAATGEEGTGRGGGGLNRVK